LTDKIGYDADRIVNAVKGDNQSPEGKTLVVQSVR